MRSVPGRLFLLFSDYILTAWPIPCVLSSLYSQPLILMFFFYCPLLVLRKVLGVPSPPFTNHMAVLQVLPQPCIQEFLTQPTFPCLNNTSVNPPPSPGCFTLLTRLELRLMQVWWLPFFFSSGISLQKKTQKAGVEQKSGKFLRITIHIAVSGYGRERYLPPDH